MASFHELTELSSSPISKARDTRLAGAMSAAEERTPGFEPVTNYSALAVGAGGSQSGNGALKTVEIAGDAVLDDFQWFIVFVATDFAGCPAVRVDDVSRGSIARASPLFRILVS